MPPEISSDSNLESSREVSEEQKTHKYQCSVKDCKASFRRLDHLDRHEYKHTGIKKHICGYNGCSRSYSIITHLKRHIRTTHEKTERLLSSSDVVSSKLIKCQWTGDKDGHTPCQKVFMNVTNMQRHVREVHENPKIYECSHCEMSFKHKLKLKRHEIQQHTHSYPFNCEKCKRGFYQNWQLEKHSCEQSKTYRCGRCDEEFQKWSLYIKHCRDLQHGRQYHHCEHCGQKYSRPSELRIHVKLKHSVLGDNGGSGDGNVFRCPHKDCSKTYTYEKNLKQHIRSTHEGKRYLCSYKDCGKDFTSVQNLHKHFIRHKAEKTEAETKTNASEMKPKDKKIRKQRKDAGIPKVSTLAKAAGLVVDKEMNEKIRCREAAALERVADSLKFCLQMDVD